MKRTISSLAARNLTRSTRAVQPARPTRKTRLKVDTLEDRQVPAVVGFLFPTSSVIEQNPQTNPTITVTVVADAAASFTVRTMSGSATVGEDFQHFEQQYTNETSVTFSVVVLSDTLTEGDEVFFVNIADEQGGATVSTRTHTVTILDDDGVGSVVGRVWADRSAPPAGVGIQEDEFENGISGVTVQLKSGSSIVASTTTGSNGAYAFNNQPQGDYHVQVVKPPDPAAFTTKDVGSDDSDSDVDSTGKTDTFRLQNGATEDRDAGLLNMTGSSTTVSITKLQDTVEGFTGSKAGKFQLTRSGDTTGSLPVTVNFTGRATPISDYLVGGLTIPAGEASLVVDVTAADDGFFEQTEDVVATVVSGTGYSVGSLSEATLLIADKNAPNDFPAEDSDCGCGPDMLGGGAAVGGSGAVGNGGSKARYADGVLGLRETDLSTAGFGSFLSLTRVSLAKTLAA